MTTIELKPSANPLSAAEREAILADPGFGRHFTDHMVTIRWTEGRGWHDAQLTPYAPLSIDPANMTLHYAQEIFEGLKAYRRPDGSVATFRPQANAERFQVSARRLAMPELPVETFIEACDALVRQDKDWVPEHGGEASLYLRPFMIAAEVGLGVRPANEYLFIVIASPAGPYFADGVKPVSVWLSENYVRAVPGGMGFAKTGGNYAASLLAQAEAAEKGCDQVVWLDALEHRWVEEMGGMNLYFVYGDKIVTPELTGSLLAGITRDSLLTLARDLGYESVEGRISTEQWRRDTENGTLTEVFACGTAAAITPVGRVKSTTGEWLQSGGEPGELTMQLRNKLLAIQTGAEADEHGWMHELG
ncbi:MULTISPECIES: branched-chain amino acid aminotransferase [Streptomyces]|uniref:Branched-chain-amino-acid aminotransferase n=1 Tax=Streptomyces tsukubensis (strain DSM 42081 / NBRC 108919 / NRRL 18488 / 9993) TaxID=1114943 RepID=I2N6X8_STRT9|nr:MULTISPECIES: branched-chain amino acid aminotransferase [Streptomyces]AZK96704.1 branched chain amino acid aminotransferase [Streptomyces tsukubensis]EIF92775.1 branched-chain amino acid aminotransferase [Streptomyces tsukubensis NRRL18488]MYS63824.1 branched-chain amino acid aminotransferase [Streptomyces sp. SID5473]QKM67302.1 branched-chain amino acid aminotransferase [Streptomyces tsukubensis NRRL18488]TAI42004.1 branched-chain amino acid aminotransferase [Streptomyces tsukubensis]